MGIKADNIVQVCRKWGKRRKRNGSSKSKVMRQRKKSHIAVDPYRRYSDYALLLIRIQLYQGCTKVSKAQG